MAERFEEKYALLDKQLGEGGFARVQLGKVKKTHKKVAVKIFPYGPKVDDIDVRSEVAALQRLDHKHIIRVLDTYEGDVEFYVVMELIPGGATLLDLFTQNKDAMHYQVTEANVRSIIYQVVSALHYALEHGIVHRDVKLDNILVRDWKTWDVALADFNLSKEVQHKEMELKTELGTFGFKAPEIYTGKKYNYKCDIWSLGVLAYVLLSWGNMPYVVEPNDSVDNMERAMKEKFKSPWAFVPVDQWRLVSKEARDMVAKMLLMRPKKRIDYKAINKHKWRTLKLKNPPNLNPQADV